MLFLAFLLRQVVWNDWLSHELFLESLSRSFIEANVVFTLEIAPTKFVVIEKPFATFFVFEK